MKGLTQIAALGGLLIATAFVEAALPVLVAEHFTSADNRMKFAEYGSLRGWQKCMSENSKLAPYEQRTFCENKISIFRQNALTLSGVTRANDQECAVSDSSTRRVFKGWIQNQSENFHVTSASAYGALFIQRGTGLESKLDQVQSASMIIHRSIAPGETIGACLFTLSFPNEQEAQAFDKKPVFDSLHTVFVRGVEDRKKPAEAG